MIRISTESGLRHSIEIGPHLLHTDVPESLGGGASGPEPHDLFDAALGACKALTLMLYAKQRGLPLDSLDLHLVRDDSQERQGTYRLRVTLQLGGELSDAQRQELLNVAGKCPVQKLMTQATTEVLTELAP